LIWIVLPGDRFIDALVTLARFVYGYPKSKRANITDDELKGFKKLAEVMLNYNEEQLQTAVQTKILRGDLS
jgi:hypothetical protein